MRAQLRHVSGKREDGTRYEYDALAFVCPGCERVDPDDGSRHGGLHMLPVAGDANGRPMWTWDGNLEAPTLSPSILSRRGEAATDGRPPFTCHSYLKAGVFEFLTDCTHELAGQHVPLPDLYEWAREN